MDRPLPVSISATFLSLLLFTSSLFCVVHSTQFKIVNKCRRTIWPGILTGAGRTPLYPTGFTLKSSKSRTLSVPRSWSGRVWGRTGCSTDPSTGKFTCLTADCGSGKVECAGSGAIPPATLAEFTLNGDQGLDFYDVSLVDGYNLPMLVVAKGGTRGGCSSTGCLVDLNAACPSELKVAVGNGSRIQSVACKSACEAFGDPVYCCSEGHNTPDTCSPSEYSLFFKHACPRAYSYAYDDKTSTFTCASADYLIIFCPSPYTRWRIMTLWKICSMKLLGARREAAELPLVNKTTMYIGRSHSSTVSSPVAFGTTFTFINKCEYTVWPGILANAGSPTLDSTGFELPGDSSRSFIAPAGWSGRFWGRTGCNFDGSGSGSCSTGDCGSGQVECNGAGADPPATLAEFSLGTGGQDFYDVSLVDGYNVAMIVEATGGSGMCASTGCVTDLNRICPSELRVGEGDACKSACEAFRRPEYCCSGEYNSPSSCRPSVYSQVFKSACPRSYSYAYDDPTSTFTCTGADYTLTFCPSTPSQKSSKDPTPTMTTNPNGGDGSMSESGGNMVGSQAGSGSMEMGSGSESGSGSEALLADGSYLAGLAMGESTRINLSISVLHYAGLFAFAAFLLSFLQL